MNSRPSRSNASRTSSTRATSRAPQSASSSRASSGARATSGGRRRPNLAASKAKSNPALMWGAIGAGVLVVAGGIYLLSGPKEKKSEVPPVSGYSQMQAYQGEAPAKGQSSTSKPAPRKTAEELAADRRKAEDENREALVARLEKEVDPKVIKQEADWAKVSALISEAEQLVGVDPSDRRATVGGTHEEKKAAKTKADEALKVLETNRVFKDTIQTYDEALAEAPNFAFFQDVRNRVNSLRMRLKGL